VVALGFVVAGRFRVADVVFGLVAADAGGLLVGREVLPPIIPPPVTPPSCCPTAALAQANKNKAVNKERWRGERGVSIDLSPGIELLLAII
jgi:hypothetical protein